MPQVTSWRLLLAGAAIALAGCSATPPQIAPVTSAQPQSRTVQCRDLKTGAISGHMGSAPECDPGQEQVWSNQTGNAASAAPRLAAVAPRGISFARYCYDTVSQIARGSDSECAGDGVELSSTEYRALAHKQLDERITAYQILHWYVHKEKPHATPAQIVGTAIAISNGGIYVTRYSAIEGCSALSLEGSIADVIAVDVEDDVAALVSVARAGVVTSFRAGPPRRLGEPMLAIAHGGSAGGPQVTFVHVAAGAEIAGRVLATVDGAPASLGNGALLLDGSGNTAGVVLALADSSSGKANYLTAEGLGAILDFWRLPYQTAESMIRPVGCWRDS